MIVVKDGTPSRATVAWALRALGGARARVTPVRVGSTAVHRLEVARPSGGQARFALRRFVDGERLRADPWYVPRHEAVALELLESRGVPAPRLVAADVEAAECDSPTLLTTWLPGDSGGARPPPRPEVLEALAAPLPLVHGVTGDGLTRLPAFAPYYRLDELEVPAWSSQPAAWRRGLDHLRSGEAPAVRPRLIHRDYHPGNTLWEGRRLTGVVDWTTACLGPPGVDLARVRQNLALLHGPDAAASFLAAYGRVTGRADDRHPWWDFLDAADMLADTPAPGGAAGAARLRGWERWVAGVVAEMA